MGRTPETSSRARRQGSGDGCSGGQKMSESRKRAECARFRGWEAGGSSTICRTVYIKTYNLGDGIRPIPPSLLPVVPGCPPAAVGLWRCAVLATLVVIYLSKRVQSSKFNHTRDLFTRREFVASVIKSPSCPPITTTAWLQDDNCDTGGTTRAGVWAVVPSPPKMVRFPFVLLYYIKNSFCRWFF